MDYIVFVVSMYITNFLISFNLITIAFWLITVGMIITFCATKKKGIDDSKFKWIALFAAEACGLVLSFIFAEWFSGKGALSESSFASAARVGTIVFLAELVLSLLMLRRYRNKEIEEFVYPG